MLAGQKNKVYLKVGLTGFALEKPSARPAVNVAIVLDKSGSMSGQKLMRAKEAARMAVDRLSPDDIVSVISYDSTVKVVVPATKASDKPAIHAGIGRLAAGGNTALFAGVSKGADELRKFLAEERVNRVILLSDGLANVGPSTPGDLEGLGVALGREGMSVTTIGLGLDYNEDLMTKLAAASDGNHVFVERPEQLAHFFNLEFGDVLSVVAQDVEVTVRCAPGVRPVRALGREADIVGQEVRARLNQLYAEREKFVMLELEVQPNEKGATMPVVEVGVTYGNMVTGQTDQVAAKVTARYTDDAGEVQRSADRDVMVKAIQLEATERNRMAMLLNDQGKRQEAQRVLQDNAAFLNESFRTWNAPSLKSLEESNLEDSKNLDPEDYRRQRKQMRRKQYMFDMQQSY
ncbi:MAG: VWA domain-containing protein [Myxococcales bacterium]|nr:VWA domain-containing protein [Myxococcales bacterium]